MCMRKLFTFLFILASLQLSAQVEGSESASAFEGGLEGAALQNAIATYPNPVVGFLHIDIVNPDFEPTKFQLFDLLGNMVLEQEIYDLTEIKIDLSERPSEIYLLKVYDSFGNRITKRVIKK